MSKCLTFLKKYAIMKVEGLERTLEALVSDGGQNLKGGISMMRKMRAKHDAVTYACDYALERYNRLTGILGEVIEDLPVLVLPKMELALRDSGVSVMAICGLIGFFSIMIGVPL